MPMLTSYDPSTTQPIDSVEITDISTLPLIVENASKAQKQWANLSVVERQYILIKAYKELVPLYEQLSLLISQEMGKDAQRASYEVGGVIQNIDYFAQEIGEALASEHVGRGTEIQYKPLGVVAVISPWNYPLAMANNLLLPALIAGNSVILKPSEETPLVAQLFVNTLNNILPEHVLQLVQGEKSVGQALVSSDINMVAFTGSVAAGKDIMKNAADKLKRLVMELGGNDPMIVLASADIDAAAQFAVASSFENTGQMCISTERIYVDERIAPAFERKVVALARRYQAGPWHQANVNIGPLVNTKQHDKVIKQLQDATDKGAQFLLGSDSYPTPYIQPTVVSGLSPDMLLEQDETFGPIVAISTFKHISEAVSRANNTNYGLGAVVFGGQGASAVAEQLEAGMIGINQGVGGGNAPWVGAKQSGFGFHGSAAGHRQFSQVRVINK